MARILPPGPGRPPVELAFRASPPKQNAIAARPRRVTDLRCRERSAWASGAALAAARKHAGRDTFFGHAVEDAHPRPGPQDGQDGLPPEWNFAFARREAESPRPRSGGNTPNSTMRVSWFGAALIAALRRRQARLVPAEWRIARQPAASGETIVASFGPVTIRRIPAGCFAVTCVNGEPAQARETAVRRLADYLNGNNRDAVRLDAERPVIQQQVGPRLWRISARLRTPGTAAEAPASRTPKVKLLSRDSTWLAIVRMTGQPTFGQVASGDTIVLDAITNTEWVATGAPMIRLHASGPVQWLAGGFEIAVPVAPRHRDGSPCPEQPVAG